MKTVRRDVVRVCVRKRQWRMAFTVLLMPPGYELTKYKPTQKGGK